MSLEGIEVLLKNLLRENMRSVKNQLKILSILGKKWKKPRDKKSPTKPMGTKSPRQKWAEKWKGGPGHKIKSATNSQNFQRRYMPRPNGPTKAVEDVIDYLMKFPENHNFYVKSKRCYVHLGDNKWKQIHPKEFYPQLRAKILKHYRVWVLNAQPEHIKDYAAGQLEKATLDSWTNQMLEEKLGKYGLKRVPK